MYEYLEADKAIAYFFVIQISNNSLLIYKMSNKIIIQKISLFLNYFIVNTKKIMIPIFQRFKSVCVSYHNHT